MNWVHPIFSFLTFAFFHPTLSGPINHVYQTDDEVLLWMGTLKPFYNKQETHSYYSLPFCQGPKGAVDYYETSLLDALQGIKYDPSGLYIGFTTRIPKTEYCAIYVTEEKAKAFKHAIYNEYRYEMSLDQLPIWGNVGEKGRMDENDGDLACYLYTHKKFEIMYNGNQIVGVNLANDMTRVKITPNITIVFSYEVNWISSLETFEHRYDKYVDPPIPFERVYWSNLLYNLIKAIIALSIVYIISFRSSQKRRSLSRTNLIDNTGDFSTDDQCDLSQPSRYPLLFSSLIGIGTQFIFGIMALFLYGTYLEVQVKDGSLVSAAILIYIFTCPINGYSGGGLYERMGGQLWMSQLLFSTYLGPLLIWGVTMIINLAANYFQTTHILSVEATILWTIVCLSLPLFTAIGTVLVKNRNESFINLNNVKMPLELITKKKWFLHPLILIPCSGIFSFDIIFLTLKHICDSFWKNYPFVSYNYVFLTFLYFFTMASCIGVVSTYLSFKGGHYSWKWISFLGGASIGVYVFIYSIYYFIVVSGMYSIFQGIFYFAYMTLISLAFGVTGAALSFTTACEFVVRVYSPVNSGNRQQNILQYVLSENSNNPIWLIPDQSLEKPVGDLQKNKQDNTDLPHLHSFDNLISKDNAQV